MEILSSRAILRPADPGAALAFYRDVLGLAVYREFPGGTVFFLGERPAGGVRQRPTARRRRTACGCGCRYATSTPPTASSPTRVTILREPRREPWGLDEMWVADPDGTRIVLVHIPPEHPIRRDVRGD